MSKLKWTVTGLIVAAVMAAVTALVAFLVHEDLTWETVRREASKTRAYTIDDLVPDGPDYVPYGGIIGGEVTSEQARCATCGGKPIEGVMHVRHRKFADEPYHDECWAENKDIYEVQDS